MKTSTESNIIKSSTSLPAPVFTRPEEVPKGPVGLWSLPVIIALNNFVFKSLSNWSLNFAIGCLHACLFCYVSSVSANKLASKLERFGIGDPDSEWGHYLLLRPWDEEEFRKSLRRAEAIPVSDLKPDGNRAVMLCTTTDPYQTIRHPDPELQQKLNAHFRFIVQRSVQLIRDESSLNVRILTRSALARKDFDLFKSLGNRLAFGMSLPTLDNQLSKIYEPNAPAPSQRLATLKTAKDAGLNIFVALAPTYPECDEADLRRTLTAVKELNPLTIYHEPINIRAENVQRIESHAASLGVKVKTEVFAMRESWWNYALESLFLVERLAGELELGHCLHLWPDKSLGNENAFLNFRRSKRTHMNLTKYEQQKYENKDREIYNQEYLPWLNRWWNRISEWPGK